MADVPIIVAMAGGIKHAFDIGKFIRDSSAGSVQAVMDGDLDAFNKAFLTPTKAG